MKTVKLFALLITLICFVNYAEAQSWETLKRKAKSETRQEITKAVRKTVGAGVPKSVKLNAIPTTLEEFDATYNEMATTPEGAIIMFLAAMDIYAQNEELGKKCFALCFHPEKRNGDEPIPYFVQFMRSRFHSGDGQSWLARSYFDGATPENGYTPKEPLTLKMKSRANDDDYLTDMDADVERRWVNSSGADSERPVQVLRVRGENLYYMFNYAGLASQVRKPKRR